MIIVGGMVGLGKSSVAKLLGEHFGCEVYYESVEDNPILPLFYTASEEEIKAKRYPFLLQLYFLDAKIASMRKAAKEPDVIIDRSIYEDWYFAKVNNELGRISDMEYEIYKRLLKNMLQQEEDKQAEPELMIYLRGSFETVLKRILKRGRSYELDEHLKAYYKRLWEGYDEWIMTHHHAENMLVIDMDEYDVVQDQGHAQQLIQRVEMKRHEIKSNKNINDNNKI